MLKLFKNAFKFTNDGIILATPLILFIWIITLYLSYAANVVDTAPEMILAVITLLCMIGAFCAGWFYMVKKSIELSQKEFILDEDRAKEKLELVKKIPAGIGKYFLSFVGMSLISLVIFAIFAAGIYKIGMNFIGSIDFSAAQIKTIMANPQDIKEFLDSLTDTQLYKLAKWDMLFLAATTLMSFLMLLWIPEIIYQTQNPLLALFKSIKKLFVKFGKSIALFIYLTFVNLVISFANTFSLFHPIIYMIMMIVYFYFLVYVIVLIFSYYDKEFNEKPEE